MENNKLKRGLSSISVWSIAVGSIIGWGAFVMPGNLFLPTAGPLGTIIGMTLGAMMMIAIAISYGYLIEKIPVAGGEFAYAFNGFGRIHAFICSWLLLIAYISIVPLNATALGLIGRYMFPGLLQKGYLYSIVGWEVYAGEVIVSSLALIIFAYIAIRGVKVSGSLQIILTGLLVLSVIALLFTAMSRGSFENLKPAFPSGSNKSAGVFSIIAIAPWAFVGFDSISQAAEEFNFHPRKATKLMATSILVGAFIYIAMNTITASAFSWEQFINEKPFWATGSAVTFLWGNTGLLFLGIALTTAIFAGIVGFFTASSRLLFSMARAHAVPSLFGEVHSRYKTPHKAILFILFLSLITPWFGREVLLWVVDMASIGSAVGFLSCIP